MLVKSTQKAKHVHDLAETFQTLRKYDMKLNPSKCVFGVSSRKFLGFVVSKWRIKANSEKVQVVLDMQSPRNIKQMQQLTRRIVALNRFISQSTDKCLPFFKILRNAIMCSEECKEAFSQLKRYLRSPPLLNRTTKGEILFLYLDVYHQ
jgi:hypothetical protein